MSKLDKNRKSGATKLPFEPHIIQAIWNRPDIFPPILHWVETYCIKFRADEVETFDVETLIGEIVLVGININAMKENPILQKDMKNQDENRKRLARIRSALEVLVDDLPALIKSAELELSCQIVEAARSRIGQNLSDLIQTSYIEAKKNLEVERVFLAHALAIKSGAGFYGPARPGRTPKEWTSIAGLLFELLSGAFRKAGITPPKQAGVSEHTPLVKILHEAMQWLGHEVKIEALVQALKRDAKTPRRLIGAFKPAMVAIAERSFRWSAK
jgi:hypothetical protein